MHRRDGGSLRAKVSKSIAGNNAAGVKGNFAFPIQMRKLSRSLRDLRIGNAEPNDVSIKGCSVQHAAPRAHSFREMPCLRSRSTAVTRDYCADLVSRSHEILGQSAPDSARSHDGN